MLHWKFFLLLLLKYRILNQNNTKHNIFISLDSKVDITLLFVDLPLNFMTCFLPAASHNSLLECCALPCCVFVFWTYKKSCDLINWLKANRTNCLKGSYLMSKGRKICKCLVSTVFFCLFFHTRIQWTVFCNMQRLKFSPEQGL